MRTMLAAVAAAVPLAGPAGAGEVLLDLGYDGVLHDGENAVAAGVELRTAPVLEIWRLELGFGAALEVDSDHDHWAGAGISAAIRVTDDFRITGSFMPGFYGHGLEGSHLGPNPMYRSRIGASYAVSDRTTVGAAFEHKSNGRRNTHNPGTETAFITIGYSFGGF